MPSLPSFPYIFTKCDYTFPKFACSTLPNVYIRVCIEEGVTCVRGTIKYTRFNCANPGERRCKQGTSSESTRWHRKGELFQKESRTYPMAVDIPDKQYVVLIATSGYGGDIETGSKIMVGKRHIVHTTASA